jgi:fimbrial chaperone protein
MHAAYRFVFRCLERPLAALLILFAGHASAQVLIEPVVVELGARQRATAVTITLSSKAAGPLVLQSEVFQWEQALDGSSRNQPTNDLVVVPPIVELKPGESQLLRIGQRGPRRAPGEQAYRLVLEDVGSGPGSSPTAGLTFRMRYDLPVLLAPAEPPRQALRWQSCAASPSEVCVRLANEGNRRVTLRKLELSGADWTLSVPAAGTVLAGAEREWRLPLPAGGRGAAQRIHGETSRGETLRADLPAL